MGITSGVPQGSILGPLLFNIFYFVDKSDLANYADDTLHVLLKLQWTPFYNAYTKILQF